MFISSEDCAELLLSVKGNIFVTGNRLNKNNQLKQRIKSVSVARGLNIIISDKITYMHNPLMTVPSIYTH